MRKFVFVLFLLFAVSSLAFAQVPQAAPGTILEWDQGADSLIVANGYSYQLTIDGAAPQAIPATCAGTASPFLCGLALPDQSPGLRTVTLITTTMLVDGTVLSSVPSASFTYEWVVAPATGTGLRLRPRPAGLTLPPPGQ